jgi:hypothetical protein
MSSPPEIIINALAPFAPHFGRERTWEKAKVLVIGTLLTNGRRVVTAALRTMGLQDAPSFNQYPQVLSRAERRWGGNIAARGIYRDGVRSSASHFVKASGLRWINVMLLTPLSWAERVWALPVLTVLAPSERFYQQRGRQPNGLCSG